MRNFRIAFLFYFLTVCATNAQTKKSIPLKNVLTAVEKHFLVSFSYLDETIAGIVVPAPPATNSLNEDIVYLRQKTGLSFEFISTNAISISPAKKIVPTDAMAAGQLEEVAVPQYLTTGISKKSDGSFVISPQKFGLLPGLTEADVLQTMQQLPGVTSVDETVSNINVRGGTHDQNLFLWNGIRMFQTGHFFGLISAFNPSLPQQITVYKNGTSAFYGESVSSAVDISTKSDIGAGTMGGFATNLINAEAFSRISLSGKASITISGRRSFTDFAQTPTYGSYSDRAFQNTVVTDLRSSETVKYNVDKRFYFYDFSLQYHQLIGKKNELTMSGIAISNDLDILQKKRDPDIARSRQSSLAQQNFGGSAEWKTNWNEKNSTEASGYISRYNLNAVNRSVENDQTLNQQNNVLDTGFRLRNIHKISGRFTIEEGYQYNETGIGNYDRINAPQFARRIKEVMRIHALVAQARIESQNRKLFVQPGLRLNYLEKFGIFLPEPRLQSGYAFSSSMRLEALAEFKSQTASQVIDLQQDFLGLEKRRWILSNNGDVPIQKSFQSSLGLTFKKAGWLLTLDGFYKKVTGISSRSQSFQNQLEFEKIQGDYTVLGSEFLAQRSFGQFRYWLSYSISNNEYTFDNFTPTHFASNFEIVHALGCAGIYETPKLKIALGAKWYSGKPETTPLANQEFPNFTGITYNDPNNEHLGDYFQANFSASYELLQAKKTRVIAGISVMNLFNTRNVINRYYRLNDTNDGIERVNTYSLGRTPNVDIKVYF
jgi:hypothetical protein